MRHILIQLLLLFNCICYCQSGIISGKITNPNNVPLSGVNIIILGTQSGTSTDDDGLFSIEVSLNQVLQFKFIGFKSQELTIDNYEDLNIILQPEIEALNEVILNGYSSQSRRFKTDNISKIDMKDLNEIHNPNMFNALSGKISGVRINQTNGKLESGLNINIRGQSSINASSDPLYIIDGVPLMNSDLSSTFSSFNPLITLSPNEIESITVLKDASSASIYGARAANGVVLISTKKGKPGKTQFILNISNAVSTPSNLREWLNSDEYVELLLESAMNSSNDGNLQFVKETFDRISNNTWEDRPFNTDWQKIALIEGYVRDISLSASGGSDKTTYYSSIAYNDSKGIVDGNELDRLSARLNFNHKLGNSLEFGTNLSYSRTDVDRVSTDGTLLVPLGAVAQAPISPAFLDGQPFANTAYPNYLLEDKYSYFNAIAERLNGKVFTRYHVLSNLMLDVNFGFDLFNQTEDQFRGAMAPLQPYNGFYFSSDKKTDLTTINAISTFDKTFKDIHDFQFILGAELINGKLRSRSVSAAGFPTDDFQNISSASRIIDGDGFNSSYRFISYFSRLSYTLRDKYLFKASVRREGSSRFGSNNRFGTFPSLSLAWIISEEPFIKSLKSWVDFLKVRGSWGEVGNAEIGDFQYRNLFFAVPYDGIPGIEPGQPGNSSLTWETSKQIDLGVEFSVLNKLISGEVSYYFKENDGLLFNEPLLPSTGPPTPTILRNVGELTTKGIEFSLGFTPVNKDKLRLSYDLNLTQVNNRIIKLPQGNDIVINFGLNLLREGEPINSFYLIEYAGVDPMNGDALYFKNSVNPNGTLDRTTTNNPSEAQRIVAGQAQPDWIGGLTQYVTYKNFDLTATFIGEWGADIYNLGGRFESSNGEWFDNQTRDQLRRWQNPGDITDVPQARFGINNGSSSSTRYLEEGDFVRLRNLTLGYNFSTSMVRSWGIDSARLYLTGVNLLTFTNYNGYDPESRADRKIRKGSGLVILSAPSAKTYSIGVNLKF